MRRGTENVTTSGTSQNDSCFISWIRPPGWGRNPKKHEFAEKAEPGKLTENILVFQLDMGYIRRPKQKQPKRADESCFPSWIRPPGWGRNQKKTRFCRKGRNPEN